MGRVIVLFYWRVFVFIDFGVACLFSIAQYNGILLKITTELMGVRLPIIGIELIIFMRIRF